MAGRTKRQFHEAALRVIERMDSDITPETIYWRALYERCKRYALQPEPDGSERQQQTVAAVRMMPFGIGKEKPE